MWHFSDKKAVFLDRDGVINQEKGYISRWEDFVLLPDVVEALQLLQAAGYLAIVITNQSGIAKGIYSEKDVQLIHEQFSKTLQLHNTKVDAFYYCPHHPEGTAADYSFVCSCRKPDNGMIVQAAQDFGISLKKSFLIGDSERDILAGKKSGCTTVGVKTGHGFSQAKVKPDYLADNLYGAVKIILSLK